MKDLLDSRNHSARRTLGKKLYSNISGFIEATAKKKFPPHIEILLDEHICKRLSIAYLEVDFGRKELEEFIQPSIPSEISLNKRSKRKKLINANINTKKH